MDFGAQVSWLEFEVCSEKVLFSLSLHASSVPTKRTLAAIALSAAMRRWATHNSAAATDGMYARGPKAAATCCAVVNRKKVGRKESISVKFFFSFFLPATFFSSLVPRKVAGVVELCEGHRPIDESRVAVRASHALSVQCMHRRHEGTPAGAGDRSAQRIAHSV